jgi:hypothetical protein
MEYYDIYDYETSMSGTGICPHHNKEFDKTKIITLYEFGKPDPIFVEIPDNDN